jgi:hypothetical protein
MQSKQRIWPLNKNSLEFKLSFRGRVNNLLSFLPINSPRGVHIEPTGAENPSFGTGIIALARKKNRRNPTLIACFEAHQSFSSARYRKKHQPAIAPGRPAPPES